MLKKRLWIPIAVIMLLAAGAVLWFLLAGGSPYTYTLKITDADGKNIEDIRRMAPGDSIFVTMTMKGPEKAEKLEIYGLEGTLTAYGMEYCGDGKPFASEACASYKKQIVSGTETVDFLYYDAAGVGITVHNPCTIGTCSFVLRDPEAASVVVTTALIYPTGEGTAFEIEKK